MPSGFTTPRRLIGAAGLFAFSLVTGGIVLAQTLNLAACPLCVLQRMLYLLLALEAAVTLAALRSPAGPTIGGALMTLTALAGAGIAGYQSWLQRFPSGIGCALDQPWWERLVNWAGKQLPLLFEASGSCSEAGWKLIGLSIAEWSLLCFTALAGLGCLAAIRRK